LDFGIFASAGFRQFVAVKVKLCVLTKPTNRLYCKQTFSSVKTRTVIKPTNRFIGWWTAVFSTIWLIHKNSLKNSFNIILNEKNIFFNKKTLRASGNVVNCPFFVVNQKIPAVGQGF
jgi:hypothetical protein